MNRAKLDYFVDAVMGIAFVIVIVSGFMRNYKLHRYSSYLLIALVALHLILHFTWIKDETKSFFIKEDEKYGKTMPIEEVAKKLKIKLKQK